MSLISRRSLLGASAAGSVLVSSGFDLGAARSGDDVGFKLGVASYSLRKFPRAEAIKMIQRLGLKYVNIKSYHLPLDSTPDQIREARKEFEDAGLTIVGGVSGFLKVYRVCCWSSWISEGKGGPGSSLTVVRDLREARVPAGPDELAAFETDVLAGFVLARAAAGLLITRSARTCCTWSSCGPGSAGRCGTWSPLTPTRTSGRCSGTPRKGPGWPARRR